MKKIYAPLSLLTLFLLLSITTGCSVNKWAMNKVITGLSASGSSTAFTGDDDPELVGDALPFIIKTHELLLEKEPDNPQLLLATGSMICMYAYAFIQMPAEELPETELLEQERRMHRAKKLFVRSRNYLLHALEIIHPGFNEAIRQNTSTAALAMTTIADTSLLYWTGAAWMSAISANKSDMSLIIDIPRAAALVSRVQELSDTYDNGSAHEFLCSYYGSLSAAMGGSSDKARHHFTRACALNDTSRVGPFISLASSVCVNEQLVDEYRTLLAQACSLDLNKAPSQRLTNTIYQRRARWMQHHIGDFFLLDEGDDE